MKDISNVKVIYREDDDGLEIENNIFEKILKKGVWVLYGKKDGIYECLNVGKSINVGSEILYDIACLKFLGYEENRCHKATVGRVDQFHTLIAHVPELLDKRLHITVSAG